MEQEKTVNIKDLNLSRFEKFLLALVKFYPEAKKQKELAKEAGIYESEISRWRRREKKRGESYVEFFKKYIDIDPKTLGFKLKVHEDLADKLIEIAKKNEEAKDVIANSNYIKELLSKDLKLLISCLKDKIIDLESAKEIFLKMLEAHGLSYDELVKGLNDISNDALSCYLKQYLKFLAESTKLEELKITVEDIVKRFKEEQPNIWWYDLKNLSSIFLWIASEIMERTSKIVSLRAISNCNSKESEEFVKYLAENDDPRRTISYESFENYLSTMIKKPWRMRKWIRVGCLYVLIEFYVNPEDLIDGILSGKTISISNIKIGNKLGHTLIIRAPCPLDKSECKYSSPEEILNCTKFKELLSLQENGKWR